MLPTLLAFLLTLAAASPPPTADDTPAAKSGKPINVLVITGGGYHDFERNTDALIEGLKQRGTFEFTVLHLGSSSPQHEQGATEFDGGDIFANYDAILAYHQGDLGFTDNAKNALLDFVRNDGGYVAIHSAADSHPGWEEYDRMLGARFKSHPPYGSVNVRLYPNAAEHPVVKDLPNRWTLRDEFYHLTYFDEEQGEHRYPFRFGTLLMHGRSPAEYEKQPMRPVTWIKPYGGGRVFYTILGHDIETHSDERFHRLIANALKWAASAPKPNEDGEYVLFDGKSKDGWSMAGPGGFRLEDGELVAHGGMGMLWYHERRFRDFTLTLEWKTSRIADNAGVFVRFPQVSYDPWYAVRYGHEIQICDDPNTEPTRGTGSVYGFADAPGARQAAKPPGEWNRYEITVRGDSYTVVLNGRKVLEWDSPSDRHGREGYIGLQNHDDASPVRFRNIKVKPLVE